MRLLALLPGLLALLAISKGVTSAAVEIEEAKYDFGARDGFYSIGYGISMGLVPTLSDELLKKIADLINKGNSDQISDVAHDVLNQYAGPIVFMAFGGVLALFAAVSCMILCCARCYCNACGASDYQSESTSKGWLYGSLLALLVCFAFVMTGAIIFGVSVDDTYDTVHETAFNVIIQTMDDTTKVLTNSSAEVTNTVTIYADKTLGDAAAQLNSAPDTMITAFEATVGLAMLKTAQGPRKAAMVSSGAQITKVQAALAKLQQDHPDVQHATTSVKDISDAYGRLSPLMTGLDTALAQIDAEIGKVKQQMTDPLKKAGEAVENARKAITTTSGDITKAFNDLQTQMHKVEDTIRTYTKDIQDWDGLKALRSGLQAIGLFPLSIAMLFLVVAVVGGVARISRPKTRPHKRSSPSHASSYCAAVGIYVVLIIAALMMGFTVATFFGGFVVSSICKPLFRDDKYALYKASDDFNIQVETYNSTNVVTRQLGEIFATCDESTLFHVIGGKDIISSSAINNAIDFPTLKKDAINNIPAQILPDVPGLDPALITDQTSQFITTAEKITLHDGNFLPNEDQNAQAVKDAEQALQDLKKELGALNGALKDQNTGLTTLQGYLKDNGKTRNVLVDEVSEAFDDIEQTTKTGIDGFIDALDKTVAPCHPFMTIYRNVGVLVCDDIGRPVHGMWAAMGLASLCLIPAAFALIFVARWLRRMDSHYYLDTDQRRESEDWVDMGKVNAAYQSPHHDDMAYRPIVLATAPPVQEYRAAGDFPLDIDDPNAPRMYPDPNGPHRDFVEYQSSATREDNNPWDMPLPDSSAPSTTQRLKRF